MSHPLRLVLCLLALNTPLGAAAAPWKIGLAVGQFTPAAQDAIVATVQALAQATGRLQ